MIQKEKKNLQMKRLEVKDGEWEGRELKESGGVGSIEGFDAEIVTSALIS